MGTIEAKILSLREILQPIDHCLFLLYMTGGIKLKIFAINCVKRIGEISTKIGGVTFLPPPSTKIRDGAPDLAHGLYMMGGL